MLLVVISLASASTQSTFVGLTLSNNTTGLPVITYPDLFYTQFHPGLEATYSKQLNKNAKNRLYINGNFGFYYHQFVQSLVRIYPTVSYERSISKSFNLGVGLGAGYGLSFEGDNAFVQQEDGTYRNKAFGGARSQYILGLELGMTYSFRKDKIQSPQLVVLFKSFMQGTYVKNYVPLLPLNSLNIGIRIPLQTIEQ